MKSSTNNNSSKLSSSKSLTSSSNAPTQNTSSITTTSSPNLPITPTTSASPPMNVIRKKESALSNYDSSSLNENSGLTSLTHHYSSNDALRLGGKDSSPSESVTHPHNYGVSLKHELYNSPKRQDYGKLDYSEKFPNSLGKDQYGSSRLTANLTPLGTNSSIITTPSPPITPQSLGNHTTLTAITVSTGWAAQTTSGVTRRHTTTRGTGRALTTPRTTLVRWST